MRLVLEDGTTFEGLSFGADVGVAGELVFNTAMTGYVETLTDPSYCGQLLVTTQPLVGNYGVPAPRQEGQPLAGPFESDRIQVQALIVQNYVEGYSHHAATRSLSQWLQSEGVPAVTGIDTRALTRHLRAAGTMRATLLPNPKHDDAPQDHSGKSVDMRREVFYRVAPPRAAWIGEGGIKVLLVDVGAKDNIVRSLLARDVAVLRAPWHEDLSALLDGVDGVLIGNGPGDPRDLGDLVAQVRQIMDEGSKPVMGICLGNQILARAAGAETFKLPYGHRGLNQPVQDLVSRRCFITSQNHGFAVADDTLPCDWEPWFVNINDGSNEGIRHKFRPYFGVQFHPEAHPGPEDTAYLFDEFIRAVRINRSS